MTSSFLQVTTPTSERLGEVLLLLLELDDAVLLDERRVAADNDLSPGRDRAEHRRKKESHRGARGGAGFWGF